MGLAHASTSGTYTTIDAPNSAHGTSVYGINDTGDPVGEYDTGSGHREGFLYHGGIYTTIDDPNAVHNTAAFGINGTGSIVGGYVDGANTAHGFLYTPTPSTPDLSLTNVAPSTVVSGKALTYPLTATNSSTADDTCVQVVATLPASIHFSTLSTTKGTCTRTTTVSPKTQGGTVSCSVGDLAVGESVTVTVAVTATTPGTLTATATATASNVPSDADDSATATTVVLGN